MGVRERAATGIYGGSFAAMVDGSGPEKSEKRSKRRQVERKRGGLCCKVFLSCSCDSFSFPTSGKAKCSTRYDSRCVVYSFPMSGLRRGIYLLTCPYCCIPTSGFVNIPSHGIRSELATDQIFRDCATAQAILYLSIRALMYDARSARL